MVVTFFTGDPELCRRMDRRGKAPGSRSSTLRRDAPQNWPQMRRGSRHYRVGVAPVLLTKEPNALRRAAYRLAPQRILAYNSRLERHHLGLNLPSLLFWRGIPIDRIYLRLR